MSTQYTDYIESAQSNEVPLPNELRHIDYGTGADCVFTIKCNGQHFEVLLPANSVKGSIERHYLDRIETSTNELEPIFDEINDILAAKCQPWFREFSGHLKEMHATQTLHDIIRPSVVRLRMITVDGQPQIISQDDSNGPYTRTLIGMHRNDFPVDIPTFQPSDIQVLEILKQDAVFKVEVMGSTMCAKIAVRQSQCQPIRREINVLQHIRNTASSLRVPSLFGLIVLGHHVLGFLMEYVATEPSCPNLSCCEMSSVSMDDRQDWYCQVEYTLKGLHEISLVWGDAKAENILLDRDGYIWITDFGGSYTEGWVERELSDSRQGDLQGVERLREFLKLHTSCL